jgi:pimeloyl-ACP methyl ester carboxylesterase
MIEKRYTLVAGTHAYDGTFGPEQWYHPGSLFSRYVMRPYGAKPARALPFIWSTDLDGFIGARNRSHVDWKTGGYALAGHLDNVPLRHRNVIAHSFGGPVVAYAMERLPINNLITVGTPIRRDLEPVWEAAMPNLRGDWIHLADHRSDWMIRLGQMFDGRFGWRYDMPLATSNVMLPRGMGHSSILNDPDRMTLWFSQGWLDALFGVNPR